MQKRPKCRHSRAPVAKPAVDLTTVEMPVIAPDETPVQAVAHPISPEKMGPPPSVLFWLGRSLPLPPVRIKRCAAPQLGRVDGFGEDEHEAESDEGSVVPGG